MDGKLDALGSPLLGHEKVEKLGVNALCGVLREVHFRPVTGQLDGWSESWLNGDFFWRLNEDAEIGMLEEENWEAVGVDKATAAGGG